MKTLLIFLLFISLPAFADEWTDADVKREAIFFGLRTFTYLQTYGV